MFFCFNLHQCCLDTLILMLPMMIIASTIVIVTLRKHQLNYYSCHCLSKTPAVYYFCDVDYMATQCITGILTLVSLQRVAMVMLIVVVGVPARAPLIIGRVIMPCVPPTSTHDSVIWHPSPKPHHGLID